MLQNPEGPFNKLFITILQGGNTDGVGGSPDDLRIGTNDRAFKSGGLRRVMQWSFDDKIERTGNWSALSLGSDPSLARRIRIRADCPWAHRIEAAREFNPLVMYTSGGRRGYLRGTVDERNWKSEFRVVQDATRADSPVTTDHEIDTRDV